MVVISTIRGSSIEFPLIVLSRIFISLFQDLTHLQDSEYFHIPSIIAGSLLLSSSLPQEVKVKNKKDKHKSYKNFNLFILKYIR